MTFSPQYGTWAREDFNSADGSQLINSGDFGIIGGVTKLIPNVFSEGTHTFDAPWDPVSGWDVRNNMDSQAIVDLDFNRFETGNGIHGNIGSNYRTAFYTSGEHSNFMRYLGDVGRDEITIEFGARAVPLSSASTNSLPHSGFSRHGLYIGDTNAYTFIEVHPNGLNIRGVSGAFLPADYSSSIVKTRVTLNGSAVTVMAQSEENMYAGTGHLRHDLPGQTGAFIAFGSMPFDPNLAHASGNFHAQSEALSLTGFAGFTMWDDVKIALGQSVSKLPNDYIPPYPVGLKTIYTAPWYPSDTIDEYLGAYVYYVPITGGQTTVTLQKSQPLAGISGSYEVTDFTDVVEVDPVSLRYDNAVSKFMNIEGARVFASPFKNALRFKIESESLGGAAPEIDSITVIGKAPSIGMNTIPNWKLSTLPKDLYFVVDEDKHNKEIPPANHQDYIYFHNEKEIDSVPALSYTETHAPGRNDTVMSGLVLYASADYDIGTGAIGLRSVEGKLGKAWSNFNVVRHYDAEWSSQSHRSLETRRYHGDLLDNYDIFPSGGAPYASGGVDVTYALREYDTLDGETTLLQGCSVLYYNKENVPAERHNSLIGMSLTGVFVPNKEGVQYQLGIVRGVIEIPRGPGVVVTLHEGSDEHRTFLRGDNYRTPAPFACAAYYSGDHSASANHLNTAVTFGVLPREQRPGLVHTSLVGNYWKDKIREHQIDEFIVHSVTGEMVDHSFLGYSGIPANEIRTSNGIDIGYQDFKLSASDGFNNTLDMKGWNNTVAPVVSSALIEPLQRNSLIFEGWFKPYGLKTNSNQEEVLLAHVRGESDEGMRLYLNRDGQVSASVDYNYHRAVSGVPGNEVSQTYTCNLGSETRSIKWGDWNHIGIVMETRAFGDEDETSNYPMFPGMDEVHFNLFPTRPDGGRSRNSSIYHAARQAKVYLELNKNLVDESDIAGIPYHSYAYAQSEISNQIPRVSTNVPAWPKIPRFVGSGLFTATIGENVFCDFDHVRFGVRDRAEALTDLFVKGSKATPPLISPDNALGALAASSGDPSQLEIAHVYRFDYPTEYMGFDSGFATNHAMATTSTGDSKLQAFDFSPEFFLQKTDGPYGRPALRIGPGSRVESPWNAFDERVFNGSGSYDLNQNRIYDSIPAMSKTWETHISEQGYQFRRWNANSHIKMSTKVRLSSYPNTGMMDILTYDENPRQNRYGDGQAYVGVNSSGNLAFGTRYNFTQDIGPLYAPGITIETGVWTQVGADFFIPESLQVNPNDDGYASLYKDGTQVHTAVVIGLKIASAQLQAGFALGYGGFNDAEENKSVFRVGGDIPRNDPEYPWSWRYNDYDVADWVIGYGLGMTGANVADTSRWIWSGVAGLQPYNKREEALIVNGDVLGPMSGVGNYSTGHAVYPATPFSDAGEQLLWVTANGGNDFEGLLQGGMALFDDGIFLNAPSYYAQYENDNAAEILGSTDSPIQIGKVVPKEGVNLALVNIRPWSTKDAISTFDLSDKNPANITQKIHGDLYPSNFTIEPTAALAANAATSNNIRVSSTSLKDKNSFNPHVGYFMHLIGGESKGVYVDNADEHSAASQDRTKYYSNLQKVKEAISVTDSEGKVLTFDEFPFKIFTSPYSPRGSQVGVTGGGAVELLGYSGWVPQISNEDKLFTTILVGRDQTIGKSVFIRYPSKDYTTNTLNVQDNDIYNPVPLMREIIRPEAADGQQEILSGYYSTRLSPGINGYDVRVWNGSFDGYIDNNQSLL